MIKLTALHYKLTTAALLRLHNITNFNESLMFNWENEVEKSRATGTDYPDKPFIEPFEFEDDDYDVTEQEFRIRPQDILYYKTNLDGLVEITLSENLAFTVKETIEEIDKFFL